MGEQERAPQLGDKPAGVTTQEYWSTVIAVFVIGCLAGWALFGKPNGIRSVFQWGSVAELLAAAGTWVIGVGAWRYTRDSYYQKVAEDYYAALDSAERMQKILLSIATKTSTGRHPLMNVDLIIKLLANTSKPTLCRKISQIVASAKRFGLDSEERTYLDKEALRQYEYLSISMYHIAEDLDELLEYIKKRAKPSPTLVKTRLKSIRKVCEIANNEQTELVRELRKQRLAIRLPSRPLTLPARYLREHA